MNKEQIKRDFDKEWGRLYHKYNPTQQKLIQSEMEEYKKHNKEEECLCANCIIFRSRKENKKLREERDDFLKVLQAGNLRDLKVAKKVKSKKCSRLIDFAKN